MRCALVQLLMEAGKKKVRAAHVRSWARLLGDPHWERKQLRVERLGGKNQKRLSAFGSERGD